MIIVTYTGDLDKGFNLNLLECKSLAVRKALYLQSCFNLNLLECKLQKKSLKNSVTARFNLNLLECKCCCYYNSNSRIKF